MTVLPPGWRRIAYNSLDSTNTALKRLIADGARDLHEGVVVTATAQTAGRGRQGRQWASPVGNLYCSILIEPPENLASAPQVGFVAAVALVDAFARPGVRLRCKWPNDVLGHGAKLSGILPELAGAWIVLGIGINLQHVDVASEYPVTSLAEQGVQIAPDDALAELCHTLQKRLTQWRKEGFGAIASAWTAVGPTRGEPATVRVPGDPPRLITGAFEGLDREGALLIATETGPRRILAGDVLMTARQAEAM
jgi:BirA family biotin operon repressor/biotin-[acetyl-CoA-carboxylase] ligase